MKFISLFAGIGGFDLALTRLGHTCVYANEWDKYAVQIYNNRFRGGVDNRDVRTVPAEEIPNHDLLVGGFPCQSFSIAGKRKGFDDTRGTLFFEIARILRAKKPRLFILENVKGLLSHDNGNTFKTIISTLDELGYDLQWQVLNSKNFGVPQNRERVFIIGNLRGTSRPEVFPVREDGGLSNQEQQKLIQREVQTNGQAREQSNFDSEVLETGEDRPLHTGQPMRWVRTEKGKEYRRQAQKQGRDLTPFNNGYRELVEAKEKVSGCLTNALQKDALLKQDMRIRRLTPIECERLQGFPDGWTEGVSDTQRYKCLGNAVTVNVINYLVSKL